MANKYRIIYMHRQQEKTMMLNDWRDVLWFIDQTKNIDGGYVIQIYINNRIEYLRMLDHDMGSDSWTNIRGEEVDLEK